VKNEIGKLLKKKYPKYSYLIKTENDEEFRKNSITRRRYSSISSTPHFINNTTISSISEGLIYIFIFIFIFFFIIKFLNILNLKKKKIYIKYHGN